MEAAAADIPPTTRVTMVDDCESDIIEVLLHATETGQDVLIRAA
ncbi:MAG: hypothetical protein OWU84_07050 [Firmicutes bacterium]|nr:hypothetical protein [Bacillota bacterium]